jgi:cell wall-associated NlpC family hydrolase
MPRKLRPALRGIAFSVLLVPAVLVAQEGALSGRTDAPRFNPRAHQDSAVVSLARQHLGRRYVWGGTSPLRGFDCSGFTQYLARALGVDLPRTAAQQARAGRAIPRDRSLLQPGDILTFGRGGRVTHVGVYVGEGRYVHASSGAGRIVESDLDRPTSSLVRAWMGVRRYFDDDSTAVVAQRPVPARAPVTSARLALPRS